MVANLLRKRSGRHVAAPELVVPPLPPVAPDAPRMPGFPDQVDDGSPWGRHAPEQEGPR